MVCVEVSEDFVSGEVYPLIICCDEGDRIDLAWYFIKIIIYDDHDISDFICLWWNVIKL